MIIINSKHEMDLHYGKKKIIYSLFVIIIYSCSVFDGHNN